MKPSNSVLLIAVLMIIAAAISRVLLYPTSFSPLIAMSLFGGALMKEKKYAVILPLAAILLSDLMFEIFNIAPGFYGWAQFVNYGLLVLITIFGSYMKKISVVNVVVFALVSCLGFYLLSNTANFLFSNPTYHTYPQTFGGYIDNMVAGLPFLKTSLEGTAIYSALFFGVYVLAMKYNMQKQAVQA